MYLGIHGSLSGIFTSLEQETEFTYKIANGRITTERTSSGDMPQTLQFIVLSRAMQLTRVDTGIAFRLQAEDTDLFVYPETR